MPCEYVKDPDAVLDYQIDWEAWLNGDTIATSSWVVDGVTLDSDANTNTTATAWLSAGTADTIATATNSIVTAAGREDDRTLELHIEER
jgi:hypothetical protein